jgi:hypothetical protein
MLNAEGMDNPSLLITLIDDDTQELTICCPVCGALTSAILTEQEEDYIDIKHRLGCALVAYRGGVKIMH